MQDDLPIAVIPFSLEASSCELAACEACLSDDEQARATRLIRPEVRRRFVAARGRLRQLLAERLSLDPARIAFEYNAHGKPRLAATVPSRLEFNLSHSGEAAVLAISTVGPVGVDIERIREHTDHRALAKRFFSPAENALLDELAGEEQRCAFFAIWTRKEAVIKALGVGLSLPLDRFSVDYRPADRNVVWHGETTAGELIVPAVELPPAWAETHRAAAAYTALESSAARRG